MHSSLLRRLLPVGLVLIFAGILIVVLTRPGGPSGHHHTHHPHGGRGSHQPTPIPPGSPQPLGIPGNWKLVLDSPFRRNALNTAIWRTGWFGDGITGPINAHESACYSSANVAVSKPTALLLKVSHTPSDCQQQSRPYTGAVLSSNPDDGRTSGGFSFRYGVLQAKVYLPAVQGTSPAKIADWPAVVTLGQHWPQDGEDDVLENLGGLVCSHFHSPGYAPGGNLGGCDPSFTPGWHIVSADWEPGSVTWYYDGIEIAHADTGITSAPMYIVLVNTVSAKSPQVAQADTMRVDYVRVWQRARPAGRVR
jgi:beta-glucanase (GH16 family)